MADFYKISLVPRDVSFGIPGMEARLRGAVPAVGKHIAAVMRKGEGSVDDQWRRQGSIGPRGGFRAWPRTKPFGNVKAPARGLKRTGQYLAAWRGEGAGSVMRIGQSAVAIGVDPTRFPQVRVFMADSPTSIRVTPRMRGYLGAVKGVHLRRATAVIVVEPRPFLVNPPILRRARTILVSYAINGQAGIADGVRRAA